MPPVEVLSDLSPRTSGDQILVDFLLPQGIIVPLTISFFRPLDVVKQVWKRVRIKQFSVRKEMFYLTI